MSLLFTPHLVVTISQANMCYGAALYIFGTILFLRAITNVAIVHPKNKTGEPGIAFFETTFLSVAFLAVLTVSC